MYPGYCSAGEPQVPQTAPPPSTLTSTLLTHCHRLRCSDARGPSSSLGLRTSKAWASLPRPTTLTRHVALRAACCGLLYGMLRAACCLLRVVPWHCRTLAQNCAYAGRHRHVRHHEGQAGRKHHRLRDGPALTPIAYDYKYASKISPAAFRCSERKLPHGKLGPPPGFCRGVLKRVRLGLSRRRASPSPARDGPHRAAGPAEQLHRAAGRHRDAGAPDARSRAEFRRSCGRVCYASHPGRRAGLPRHGRCNGQRFHHRTQGSILR